MQCKKCGTEKINIPGNKWKLCPKCRAEYMHEWYIANKKERLNSIRKSKHNRLQLKRYRILQYLLAHPCVDCGETNPILLDFDHVRGTKEFNIMYSLTNKSWEIIVKEIDKCEIRCLKCHRLRTARQHGWYKWVTDTETISLLQEIDKHAPSVLNEFITKSNL